MMCFLFICIQLYGNKESSKSFEENKIDSIRRAFLRFEPFYYINIYKNSLT